MPVVLEKSSGALAHLKVHPTRAGEAHAVTQLGATEEASAERWKSMPSLTTVNLIETVKPGATTLLSATDDRHRELLYSLDSTIQALRGKQGETLKNVKYQVKIVKDRDPALKEDKELEYPVEVSPGKRGARENESSGTFTPKLPGDSYRVVAGRTSTSPSQSASMADESTMS